MGKKPAYQEDAVLHWKNLRHELHSFLDTIAEHIIQRVPDTEALPVSEVELLLKETLPQLKWYEVSVHGPIFEAAFNSNPSYYASELHRRFQASVSKPVSTVFTNNSRAINLMVADGATSALPQFDSLDEFTMKSLFVSKSLPASLLLRAYEKDQKKAKKGAITGGEPLALTWAKKISNLLLADSHDITNRVKVFVHVISPLINNIHTGKTSHANLEAAYKVIIGMLSLCSLYPIMLANINHAALTFTIQVQKQISETDEMTSIKPKLLACFLRAAVLLDEASTLPFPSSRASKDFAIIISLLGHSETIFEELIALFEYITLPRIVKNRGGNGLVQLLVQHLLSMLSKSQQASSSFSISSFGFLRLIVVFQRALTLYDKLKETTELQKVSVSITGLEIPEPLAEWCYEYGAKHAIQADALKTLSVDRLRSLLLDLGAEEIDRDTTSESFFEDKGKKKQEQQGSANVTEDSEADFMQAMLQDAADNGGDGEGEEHDSDGDAEVEGDSEEDQEMEELEQNHNQKRRVTGDTNGYAKRPRTEQEEVVEDEESEDEAELETSFVKASELPIPFTPTPLQLTPSRSLPSSTSKTPLPASQTPLPVSAKSKTPVSSATKTPLPSKTPRSSTKTPSSSSKTPRSSSKTPRSSSVAKTPQQLDNSDDIETNSISQDLYKVFKGMGKEMSGESDAIPSPFDEKLAAEIEKEAEREEAELEAEAEKIDAQTEAAIEAEADKLEAQVEAAADKIEAEQPKQEEVTSESKDKTQPIASDISTPKRGTPTATSPRVTRRITRSQTSPLPQTASPTTPTTPTPTTPATPATPVIPTTPSTPAATATPVVTPAATPATTRATTPAATPVTPASPRVSSPSLTPTPTRRYIRRAPQTPQPTKPAPSVTLTTVKRRKRDEVADLQASMGRLTRKTAMVDEVSTPTRRSARKLKQ